MKKILAFAIAFLLIPACYGQTKEYQYRFSIAEGGKLFRDLRTDDLSVKVNGQVVGPTNLRLQEGSPLKVLFLIDASVSQERVLPIAKGIVEHFINRHLKADRDLVGIAKFAQKMIFVQSLTNDFAAAKRELRQIQIEVPDGYVRGGIVIGTPSKPLPTTGSTSISSSVANGIGYMEGSGSGPERKAIILISDGVETTGEKKRNEVIEESVKTHIPVFAFALADKDFIGMDETYLKKISLPTGGNIFVPNPKFSNLTELTAELAENLRAYYEVSLPISSSNSKSIAEVSIDITNPQLKSKKLKVTAQKGVYVSN